MSVNEERPMSSGACRALVAVVLTLAATIVMTLPVAARSDDLCEGGVVTYEVQPSNGSIRVRMTFTLTTGQADWQPQRWGPIVVESATTPAVSGAAPCSLRSRPGRPRSRRNGITAMGIMASAASI